MVIALKDENKSKRSFTRIKSIADYKKQNEIKNCSIGVGWNAPFPDRHKDSLSHRGTSTLGATQLLSVLHFADDDRFPPFLCSLVARAGTPKHLVELTEGNGA